MRRIGAESLGGSIHAAILLGDSSDEDDAVHIPIGGPVSRQPKRTRAGTQYDATAAPALPIDFA